MNPITTINQKLCILGIQKKRLLAPPQTIYLDISTTCNLNCCYCWDHSLLEQQKPKLLFLPFDDIKKIFQSTFYWQVKHFSLAGSGEPTLHPQFHDIVHLAHQYKIHLILATNATFSRSLLKSIPLISNLSINFSAPTKDLYHKIQSPRNPNMYDQVISNLSYLSEISRQRKKPTISLVYIIHKYNIHCIPQFLQMASKFHVQEIEFLMIDTTPQTRCLYPSQEDQQELLHIINQILKSPSNIPHNLRYIQQELMTPRSSPYHFPCCYIGWTSLFVNCNLDVGFCCQNESLLFDNLKNKTLKEVWESPKAHQIRLLCQNHFDINKHPFQGECEWCTWYLENQQIHQDVHA